MEKLTPPSHPIGKLREAHAHLSRKVRFHTEQIAGSFQVLSQAIDELEIQRGYKLPQGVEEYLALGSIDEIKANVQTLNRYIELFGDLKEWNAEGVKLLREASKT